MTQKPIFSIRKYKRWVGGVLLASLLLAPSVLEASTILAYADEGITRQSEDKLTLDSPEWQKAIDAAKQSGVIVNLGNPVHFKTMEEAAQDYTKQIDNLEEIIKQQRAVTAAYEKAKAEVTSSANANAEEAARYERELEEYKVKKAEYDKKLASYQASVADTLSKLRDQPSLIDFFSRYFLGSLVDESENPTVTSKGGQPVRLSPDVSLESREINPNFTPTASQLTGFVPQSDLFDIISKGYKKERGKIYPLLLRQGETATITYETKALKVVVDTTLVSTPLKLEKALVLFSNDVKVLPNTIVSNNGEEKLFKDSFKTDGTGVTLKTTYKFIDSETGKEIPKAEIVHEGLKRLFNLEVPQEEIQKIIVQNSLKRLTPDTSIDDTILKDSTIWYKGASVNEPVNVTSGKVSSVLDDKNLISVSYTNPVTENGDFVHYSGNFWRKNYLMTPTNPDTVSQDYSQYGSSREAMYWDFKNELVSIEKPIEPVPPKSTVTTNIPEKPTPISVTVHLNTYPTPRNVTPPSVVTKTTEWVDESDKPLKDKVTDKDTKPAGTIDIYEFVKTVDTATGIKHIFKKRVAKTPEKTTEWVDDSDKPLKDKVTDKDTQPAGTIDTYEFVKTVDTATGVKHIFKKVTVKVPEKTTEWVDDSDKPLKDKVTDKDTQPAGTIDTYEFVKTVDTVTGIKHIFKKKPTKGTEYTTEWVDESDNPLKDKVTDKDTKPAGNIDGYSFVESKLTPTGVKHIFKKTVANTIPSSEPPRTKGNLPSTGEKVTSALTYLGLGLMALAVSWKFSLLAKVKQYLMKR